MITWDDGVTSESAAGRERGLRNQRERVVAELVQAECDKVWCRVPVGLTALAAAGGVASFAYNPAPMGVLAVALGLFGVLVALLPFPKVNRRLQERRRDLDEVQREYDEAFARMLAAED